MKHEKMSEESSLVILTTDFPSKKSYSNGQVQLNLEPEKDKSFSNDVRKLSNDVQPETEKKTFFRDMPRRTKFVLVFCSLAIFLSFAAFSQLGPFYPLEAEKKGVSMTVTGLTFSVFQIGMIVMSPIFGSHMTKLGVKSTYLGGIFVAGSCTILFGTLEMSPGGLPFAVLSITIQIVTAVGCAAYVTASFAIVSTECPQSVGTVFAILETFTGAGLMMGPVLGGVLYEIGGFGAPFYVTGSLILLNGVLMYSFLPDIGDKNNVGKKSVVGLLRSPMVVLPMLSIMISAMSISSYEATFAMHLKPFGLSTLVVALLFIVPPGVYALCVPVVGYFTDVHRLEMPLLVAGHLFYGVGSLLLGPSPLLPFLPKQLWVVVVGLVLVGVSESAVVIPGLKLMMTGAYELNYEPNIETHALVSGFLNSLIPLGGCLGPLTASAIAQEFGTSINYTAIGSVSFIMFIVAVCYFMFRKKQVRDK